MAPWLTEIRNRLNTAASLLLLLAQTGCPAALDHGASLTPPLRPFRISALNIHRPISLYRRTNGRGRSLFLLLRLRFPISISPCIIHPLSLSRSPSLPAPKSLSQRNCRPPSLAHLGIHLSIRARPILFQEVRLNRLSCLLEMATSFQHRLACSRCSARSHGAGLMRCMLLESG